MGKDGGRGREEERGRWREEEKGKVENRTEREKREGRKGGG